MMKKTIVLGLMALLCLPALSLAQESSLQTKPTMAKPFVAKPISDSRLKDLKVKLNDARDGLQDKRNVKVKNYLEKAIARLTSALDKMESVADKLGEHLTKLETLGINTTTAREMEKQTLDSIVAAKNALINLPTQITEPATIDKVTVAEAQKIRAAMAEVMKLFKTAHANLQDLVKAVRALQPSVVPAVN